MCSIFRLELPSHNPQGHYSGAGDVDHPDFSLAYWNIEGEDNLNLHVVFHFNVPDSIFV